VALAPLDTLGGIIPDLTSVPARVDALAVQHRCGGLGLAAFVKPHTSPQRFIDSCPGVVKGPMSEDVVDSLPRWKVRGHELPRNTDFENVQDSIDNESPARDGAAAFAQSGKHGPKGFPLSVRQVGFVDSHSHRLDRGRQIGTRSSAGLMSTQISLPRSFFLFSHEHHIQYRNTVPGFSDML
jgi:hypothetical protein